MEVLEALAAVALIAGQLAGAGVLFWCLCWYARWVSEHLAGPALSWLHEVTLRLMITWLAWRGR